MSSRPVTISSSAFAMTLDLGAGIRVGEQIDEFVGVVVADGAIKAGGGGQSMQAGVLVVEFVAVAGNRSQRSTQACGPVTRQANQACFLVERTADRLTDPEGGVSRELEAFAPVELVDRVLKTEVAFLDQVEQFHAGRQWIASSDAHDEAKVRSDEAIFRSRCFANGSVEIYAGFAVVFAGLGFGAFFDDLGELTLFLRVQQTYCADFV